MKEQNRVEKWLNRALELENRGHDFYSLAAKAASDLQARAFFQYMADQELAHLNVIKKIYDRLDEDSCWQEGQGMELPQSALNELFLKMTQNRASSDADLMKAIDEGIVFETEVRALYAREVEKAGCDGEKRFLTLMVGEENLHQQTLADLKLYYTDPVGWAERMDHGHLDGA